MPGRSSTSFSISYISPSFGGTWQTSGVAATPGSFASFPIYVGTDAAHTVTSDRNYYILFPMRDSGGGVTYVKGFRVDYTIAP